MISLPRHARYAAANEAFQNEALDAHMAEIRKYINILRVEWREGYATNLAALRARMPVSSLTSAAVSAFWRLRFADSIDAAHAVLLWSKAVARKRDWPLAAAQNETTLAPDPDFTAILKFYTTMAGFTLMSQVLHKLRTPEASREDLLSAVFLVEMVNIAAYTLCGQNVAADRFEGVVFRAEVLTPDTFALLNQLMADPAPRERRFGSPLSLMSASGSQNWAEACAKASAANEVSEGDILVWEIHVRNLSQPLLDFYVNLFPGTIVSTICACPLAQLSKYPEEQEVLLRGAFFQLIEFSAKSRHALIITLNTNRDHERNLALAEGVDQKSRKIFGQLIAMDRHRLAAIIAAEKGFTTEAENLRSAAREDARAVLDFCDKDASAKLTLILENLGI